MNELLFKPQSGRTERQKNTKIAQKSNRSLFECALYTLVKRRLYHSKERLEDGAKPLNLPLYFVIWENICPFYFFFPRTKCVLCETACLCGDTTTIRRTGVNLCRVLVFFSSSSSDSAETPLCVCAKERTMHVMFGLKLNSRLYYLHSITRNIVNTFYMCMCMIWSMLIMAIKWPFHVHKCVPPCLTASQV